MLQLQVAKSRYLCAFLSLWLVGLSIACVSLCLMHEDKESQQTSGLISQFEITDTSSSECPITQKLVSNAPEKLSIAFQVNQAGAPTPIIPIRNVGVAAVDSSIRLCASDPPFERLCTLHV